MVTSDYKKAWVVSVIVIFLAYPFFASGQKKGETPNIVIILADDLGYGDLSCYGQKAWQTPHIDRMASEGAKLTKFYVPMPYCAPSRASLLTGRYPFRNGIMTNPSPDSAWGMNDSLGIATEEMTLGEVFKKNGYTTSIIGKWHLGHQPQFYPTRHGFDEYYGILYSNDMRPVELMDDEEVIEYPVVQATLTKRYTEQALSFIERNRNKPFFLYLAHAMPHKPLAPSVDFYTPETKDDLYADVIRELDWSVGQIVEKLKQLKLDKNTLVFFLSDNGPWYGGSTGGLRGMKAQTWEGGLRVPFIAWWPGQIPAAHVSDELVGVIDIFPTVLKRARIPMPEDRVIDGKDMMPVLVSDASSPHEVLYFMQGKQLRAVRSGTWKLHMHSPGGVPNRPPDWVDPRAPDGVTILAPYEQYKPTAYPGVTGGDGPKDRMLFDLKTDAAEQNDVASQHPEIVKKLQGLFEQIQ